VTYWQRHDDWISNYVADIALGLPAKLPQLVSVLRLTQSFLQAQIPSRQLCDFVADTNHESSRHKSCRRFHDLCPRCRRLFQCIVTGQISLERHKRVCRKHLDMSRWLVSATFPAEKFRWKSAYWNFGVNSYSTVSRRYDAVLHIDRPAERLLGHQAGRAAAWIKDIRITVRFGDSNRQQNDTDHDDDDDATSFAAAAAADFHRSYSDWRNRKTQSSISAKVL